MTETDSDITRSYRDYNAGTRGYNAGTRDYDSITRSYRREGEGVKWSEVEWSGTVGLD